ncbi:DUF58 domain-containing protein [Plantactinospora sp. BB1]|uniref:DUF58 domain-containing protein n=1 Tax=Plantactinospora sp. BB1 TaxID=2071627 RepID=UPI000D179AA0|nr:DUF58 domain-containing protein [Plantactinospora sp. BB1]AVT35457.1 DUF58 domain-containing protein [Plantactinospora sp. BB1]
MNEGYATVHHLAPHRRLRRLELAITRRLDGLLHGQHLGLLPGAGSELTGSREYRPGEDEVRRMDWAVTARTGVPHVREVDADRELTTWVLVDSTPSMDFGTAELEKRELAVAATAAIGYLTASHGNRLGGHLLGADGIRRFPARTGREHLLGLLHTLLAAPRGPAGSRPPSLAQALAGLHRAAPRRGLVVVVSDWLDGLPDPAGDPPGRDSAEERPEWETELRRLAVRHQVLAVEVTDPRELDLPDVGLITLVDPESGRRREISTGSRRLRERYADAARQQRALLRRALRRAGAAHLALRTDRDWVTDIVRHVYAQRRLAAAARTPGPVGGPAGGAA